MAGGFRCIVVENSKQQKRKLTNCTLAMANVLRVERFER